MSLLSFFAEEYLTALLVATKTCSFTPKELGLLHVQKNDLIIVTEHLKDIEYAPDVISITYQDEETHMHDSERCGHERSWPTTKPPIWTSRLTLKVLCVDDDIIECQVFRCNFEDIVDFYQREIETPVLASLSVH